jgi:hypothetical protein
MKRDLSTPLAPTFGGSKKKKKPKTPHVKVKKSQQWSGDDSDWSGTIVGRRKTVTATKGKKGRKYETLNTTQAHKDRETMSTTAGKFKGGKSKSKKVTTKVEPEWGNTSTLTKTKNKGRKGKVVSRTKNISNKRATRMHNRGRKKMAQYESGPRVTRDMTTIEGGNFGR